MSCYTYEGSLLPLTLVVIIITSAAVSGLRIDCLGTSIMSPKIKCWLETSGKPAAHSFACLPNSNIVQIVGEYDGEKNFRGRESI